MLSDSELTATVIDKAKSLGASVAGVADVEPLKGRRRTASIPKIGMDPEVRWHDAPDEALRHEVEWPADAVSAVVIGVSHPAENAGARLVRRQGHARQPHPHSASPQSSPHGSRRRFSVKSYRPPYVIESTGIFLEGLGHAGRPRLHRQEQPRRHAGVRPAHPLAGAAPGPRGEGHRPARPRPLRRLPGALPHGLPRGGVRPRRLDAAARAMAMSDQEGAALAQNMNAYDEAVLAIPKGDGEPQHVAKYCRRCELSCPVGRRSHHG